MGTAQTAMTEQEVRDLPVIIDVPTFAAVLGIAESTTYQRVAAGDLPGFKIGQRVRVRKVDVLDLLGLSA